MNRPAARHIKGGHAGRRKHCYRSYQHDLRSGHAHVPLPWFNQVLMQGFELGVKPVASARCRWRHKRSALRRAQVLSSDVRQKVAAADLEWTADINPSTNPTSRRFKPLRHDRGSSGCGPWSSLWVADGWGSPCRLRPSPTQSDGTEHRPAADLRRREPASALCCIVRGEGHDNV
jgi:hypothetical protein